MYKYYSNTIRIYLKKLASRHHRSQVFSHAFISRTKLCKLFLPHLRKSSCSTDIIHTVSLVSRPHTIQIIFLHTIAYGQTPFLHRISKTFVIVIFSLVLTYFSFLIPPSVCTKLFSSQSISKLLVYTHKGPFSLTNINDFTCTGRA